MSLKRTNHLFAEVLDRVRSANAELIAAGMLPPDTDQSRVLVEPPREASHGDMATNAAMVLAKAAGRRPRELAEAIAEKLRQDALFERVDVAGAGFINLTLRKGAWVDELRSVLASGQDYGRAWLDRSEPEWLPIVRAKAVEAMLGEIRRDLAALQVQHEIFFSERSLVEGKIDQVAATIDALRAAGLIYRGRLAPPKGQLPGDWEDREQTLFRSTAFGDDIDRPLMKCDGTYTYFASDIAYHKSKFDRGFRTLIDVWGADHGGYVKRMQAAVKAVTAGRADLDIKIVQLVRLLRAGQPVKMSKRAGEFVMLREVVEEVGRDAV